MKTINRYNRRVRIVEEVQDLRQTILPDDSEMNYGPVDDLPIYFVVKVEVKVACFWVTVCSESCDISDGDTRAHIINRAKTLRKKLEGKDDEANTTKGWGKSVSK